MKRAFRGGARSETLKPDPVTELPLTPPAEEDDEEAAISFLREFSLHYGERKTATGKFMGVRLTTFHSSCHKSQHKFRKELAPLFFYPLYSCYLLLMPQAKMSLRILSEDLFILSFST